MAIVAQKKTGEPSKFCLGFDANLFLYSVIVTKIDLRKQRIAR